MKLPLMKEGILERRYKRFLADIRLPDGTSITAHTPNTGSMKQCAEPGLRVMFSHSDNLQRKYPHTLELIQVEGSWVDINTQRSNRVVEEALTCGILAGLEGYRITPEQRLGESRIDFRLDPEDKEHLKNKNRCSVWVEVKNVTYMGTSACACFPDAVTQRGQRHLQALRAACARGERGVILFLVQRAEAQVFAPAADIDPDYAHILREVLRHGVEPLAYQTETTPTQTRIVRRLPLIV
ncbi:MAG: DNA/RNA nuclease SfsA [Desulfuromonadaceae bacterium]|nr:DNA/RNA nuclease SfsA [Desulfuromonadaceae bacterium]